MTDEDREGPVNQNTSEPIEIDDPAVVARYEPYLRMLARTQMRQAHRAKLGASDIVQQSMLQAV